MWCLKDNDELLEVHLPVGGEHCHDETLPYLQDHHLGHFFPRHMQCLG